MKESFRETWFGDRTFYRSVLSIAVPITLQNLVTNFVNLLDNIMVGRLSTEAMSGVSIVNQFVFVFNLIVFGAISAAGIFTAQYRGKSDNEGIRATFRFKFLLTAICGLIGMALFYFCGDVFIRGFLYEDSSGTDLALTMQEGKNYLFVILFTLIPYGITQAYASTAREIGQTTVPMIASFAAVATNCILNLVLIFGLLGFPALGVVGAAVATLIARIVELLILVVWTHTHTEKCGFIVGAYRSMKISKELLKRIAASGLPLVANEGLWALGQTMKNQTYATRGVDVVAAVNICSTIANLFSTVYLSIGSAVSIILGNLLGAGRFEQAKSARKRLFLFAILSSIGAGLLLASTSWIFPRFYNTSDNVRSIATYCILIFALFAPFCCYANVSYYTLRSGGQILITMLLDSGFTWVIMMPICWIMAYGTNANIFVVYAVASAVDVLKALLGCLLVRRNTWARRLV